MTSLLGGTWLISVVVALAQLPMANSALRAETSSVSENLADHPLLDLVARQPPRENLSLELIPGFAKPAARVTLSAPIDGVLMELMVTEGQLVRQGDLLGVIDNRVAAAAVEVAKAAADAHGRLEHTKQELALATLNLERSTQLHGRQAATQHDLDEARARLEKARADVAAALEVQTQDGRQWDLEKARLEAHNIRAPFEGQVVRISEFPGASLSDRDELLTLVNMKSLEVELHLPVELYGLMRSGESFSLIADKPVNQRLQGTLRYASPLIDSATATFRCVFTIANDDLRLPAGFAVRLDTDSINHEGKRSKRIDAATLQKNELP